jgi:DNA invertase Pin-like site-specific DNA recombinase
MIWVNAPSLMDGARSKSMSWTATWGNPVPRRHGKDSEVGLGRAGIVMGLEVSRLTRNSSDWHRLLEMCALSRTLILVGEDIYDPTQVNDRLLLGLKETMSEAELHVIRARLFGGMLNKAKPGELRCRPHV